MPETVEELKIKIEEIKGAMKSSMLSSFEKYFAVSCRLEEAERILEGAIGCLSRNGVGDHWIERYRQFLAEGKA